MRLNTCSGVISLARGLENESARFYEELSGKYAQSSETFLSFAKENKKNIIHVERTYYGVISDALEGCFAFDLDEDEFKIDIQLADGAGYSDVVKKSIEIEEKIIKFYSDAAAQSDTLMADVPRLFTRIAKKRDERKLKLESLLREEKH